MIALKEDLDRVQLLGMNSYRFSIEWSRVSPVAGETDEDGWEHYDKVIQELSRRGLKPMVTLKPFDSSRLGSHTAKGEQSPQWY